jgi:WhiB family redox-sensing transcriptional regulator
VTSWRDQSACLDKDPDLFFPDTPADLARARSVCQGCPVRARCLRAALSAGEQYGVFGGLVPGERAVLPAGIGDDVLAGAMARADEASAPMGGHRAQPLIDALIRLAADAYEAPSAAIPPDPEAALHREILLRELDAYAAAHRARKPSAGRWGRNPAALAGPRRVQPLPAEPWLAVLRQAHAEAARQRSAGRAVPDALAGLDREYQRTRKRSQRGVAPRAA